MSILFDAGGSKRKRTSGDANYQELACPKRLPATNALICMGMNSCPFVGDQKVLHGEFHMQLRLLTGGGR